MTHETLCGQLIWVAVDLLILFWRRLPNFGQLYRRQETKELIDRSEEDQKDKSLETESLDHVRHPVQLCQCVSGRVGCRDVL